MNYQEINLSIVSIDIDLRKKYFNWLLGYSFNSIVIEDLIFEHVKFSGEEGIKFVDLIKSFTPYYSTGEMRGFIYSLCAEQKIYIDGWNIVKVY